MASGSSSRSDKRASSVWEYFIEESTDKKKRLCTLCGRTLVSTNSSTKGLLDHLRKIHAHEVELPKKRKISEDAAQPCVTLENSLVRANVSTGIPFSVVENTSFRHFVNAVSGNKFRVPSNTTVLRELFPSFRDEVMKSKRAKLQAERGRWLSIALDEYSVPSQSRSFLAVTGHEWTNRLERYQVLLGVEPFADVAHSSENISQATSELLKEWDLQNSVFMIVADGAASMKNAASILLIAWF